MAIVTDVDQLVKKMKDNVKEMQGFMKGWAEKKLFERRAKPLPPEEVEQNHAALVESKLSIIKEEGKEIHKKMKDTFDALKIDKKSEQWMNYVDYLNTLVIDGITFAICSSLDHLAD